jgi:glycerol kinase
MQFQADVLQCPIERPKVTESTALGAALLAGLAVGVWNAPADLAAELTVDREFDPGMLADEAQALRARWSAALERAKGWARDGE